MDSSTNLILDYFSNHPEYIVDVLPNNKYYRIHCNTTHPRYEKLIFPDGDEPDLYINIDDKDLYVTDLGTVYHNLEMSLMTRYWDNKARDEYLYAKIKNAAELHYIEEQTSCLVSRPKDITRLSNCIENIFSTIIQIIHDCELDNQETKPINI